ncbi:hypothetical protein ENH_00014880 [Eimeria necatrix]|uniref:Uncharacterized protein n=1 Tax=Eimeria necatrix TaxID=51315 RepID=U6MPJ0_9EIME|nr:hypothetical protein ENH_00014880 [Eimeria necatrix]CDJ66117.1 hypothetical protein ENH_00014880 [Eimeria necatrix]
MPAMTALSGTQKTMLWTHMEYQNGYADGAAGGCLADYGHLCVSARRLFDAEQMVRTPMRQMPAKLFALASTAREYLVNDVARFETWQHATLVIDCKCV